MRALPPFLLLLAVKPIPDTYQSYQGDYYLRYKANGFFYIRYHVFTSFLIILYPLSDIIASDKYIFFYTQTATLSDFYYCTASIKNKAPDYSEAFLCYHSLIVYISVPP